MKQLLILCIALMLILSACNRAPAEPTAAPTTEESASSVPAEPTEAPTTSTEPASISPATLFTVTEHKLFPPKQAFSAEFEAFYKNFKAAVRNKDMRFIDSILDDEIMSSFGGDPFHEYWANEQGLWSVLEEILSLGGVYYQAGEFSYGFGKCFVAPYVFTNFGETDLDALEHFAVIDKGVPVYKAESAESAVIDTLDYNILEFHYNGEVWGKGPDDFVSVTTLSGTVGHIQTKFIRSPIDYRLCIAQKDDGWKLLWLIAGD